LKDELKKEQNEKNKDIIEQKILKCLGIAEKHTIERNSDNEIIKIQQ
jgi:hypothetical protein